MKELSITAFEEAINRSISNNVDFVLISGDLFNNAIPGIDSIKATVSSLNKLKQKNISCYFIPGSHDFSPNGKTFLDVIEEAGLAINVFKPSIKDGTLKLKFTIDPKTNVKITGILGRKGQLDKNDYDILDYRALEKEDGFKIFMFHTTITEMKPKFMEFAESLSLNKLPIGFNYYAGGHVHIVEKYDSVKHHNVVYPGPLFPNSFSEFEKLKQGGFYIVDVNNDKINLKREDIKLKPVIVIEINANNFSSEQLINDINNRLDSNNFEDSIVLMRIYGTLNSGKISDIPFSEILSKLYSKGVYFFMRNTSKLIIEDVEIKNIIDESIENVEDQLVSQNTGLVESDFKNELKAVFSIMNAASSDKLDGEKTYDYESRLLSQIEQAINDNLEDKNES